MTVLALDLGTTTGWAIKHGNGLVHSGIQSFKPGRYEGGGMRFLKFSRWLDELTGGESSITVYFEEVRNHAGTDAAHIYGGFLASLGQWCESRKIPYEGVPVGTIKRAWTGKGNSGKDVMMKIARERGFNPVDDNEADALAILHWASIERRASDATPSRLSVGPAPHSKPRRRVQMVVVPVARKRVTSRAG